MSISTDFFRYDRQANFCCWFLNFCPSVLYEAEIVLVNNCWAKPSVCYME